MKLFAKGQRVEIFSHTLREWMLDGEVVEVVTERCTRDGIQVRAGSTKVVYGKGQRYKWVPPSLLEETVRALPLPRLPEPVQGKLSLAMQICHERMYFELEKGFLQWWSHEEDAMSGALPAGWLHLPGSRQEVQGQCILLWTEGSHGDVYDFEATSAQEASRWAAAFRAHAEFGEEDLPAFDSSFFSCDVTL